jgi:xylulose-5-phosphate/fructose-6-phosphate phosphoketolase
MARAKNAQETGAASVATPEAPEKRRQGQTLSQEELRLIDMYWRAANYLAVGQIYLLNNPLLRSPLTPDDIKPRLLGHWGTTPGLNFIYAHLNRVIKEFDQDMIMITGPGHGGPAIVANTWLEGSYSERYADVSQDIEGMQRLFKQFSFPGGIPSHVAAQVPGSIHEGGELGYSLSHAFGAAFDNPNLIVACVVGDGEAETGALATSWHSDKFLNPTSDGAVLPILHLNGYKIANPTLLARIPREDLESLLQGYGWKPYFVSGDKPGAMHQAMAATLDQVITEIHEIQAQCRESNACISRRWPMIVLESPKGWTGPAVVDGHKVEGSWRSHQVPLANVRENPKHLRQLEKWMCSYHPETLFDENGRPVQEILDLPPKGERRLGMNPHTNGGTLRRDLRMPDFANYCVQVVEPGRTISEATRALGNFLRDIAAENPDNFRIFGPDETASNRLDAVFQTTKKTWLAQYRPEDEDGGELSPNGHVMEMLSEQTVLGWMEGYNLTGRHGIFNTYEAFVHVVDSMFNQHAKWLDVSKNEVAWRMPVPSANYLLSSHVWRQDHNGFSHQDPGFIDLAVNKTADVIRVYLPPDANTLLSVANHCLRSTDFVNIIVAGKQPALQYLDMDSAIKHCQAGLGIWKWASTDNAEEPDVVMACAGDTPTLETLAAVDLLRQEDPDLKIRVVNVVDLMTLQPAEEHPHGLSDRKFLEIFTADKPIIFAYHGYPWLIHRLTYRRPNHGSIHVRGYKEQGTTTTPFDMAVKNDLDRFHLFADAVQRIPKLKSRAAYVDQFVRDKLVDHQRYIENVGEDMPEIRDWVWPY